MAMRRPMIIDFHELGMGLQGDRPFRFRFLEFAQLRVKARESQPGAVNSGSISRALRKQDSAALGLLQFHVHLAHPVVAFRVVRLHLQGVPVSLQSVFIEVLIEGQGRVIRVEPGGVGLQGQRIDVVLAASA